MEKKHQYLGEGIFQIIVSDDGLTVTLAIDDDAIDIPSQQFFAMADYALAQAHTRATHIPPGTRRH